MSGADSDGQEGEGERTRALPGGRSLPARPPVRPRVVPVASAYRAGKLGIPALHQQPLREVQPFLHLTERRTEVIHVLPQLQDGARVFQGSSAPPGEALSQRLPQWSPENG